MVQENARFLFDGTFHILVHLVDVNFFGENINIVNRKTLAVLDAKKGITEVDAEELSVCSCFVTRLEDRIVEKSICLKIT